MWYELGWEEPHELQSLSTSSVHQTLAKVFGEHHYMSIISSRSSSKLQNWTTSNIKYFSTQDLFTDEIWINCRPCSMLGKDSGCYCLMKKREILRQSIGLNAWIYTAWGVGTSEMGCSYDKAWLQTPAHITDKLPVIQMGLLLFLVTAFIHSWRNLSELCRWD